MRLAELGGPTAYVVGEQQLAARRRPEPLHLLQGALVGDRERPDLLDVVAPELHPQRVLVGRREDVDDAAAHGELPALLHEVDARVGGVREPAYDVLERRGVARRQLDRLQVGQALDLGLQHGADRRDDHAQRTVGRVRPGVLEPAQHREPPTDGVAARAEPLVRQRLPARVVGDQRRVQQVAERLDQVLGLTGGSGHREDGAPFPDQAGDDVRPHRLGSGEVERTDCTVAGIGHRLGEGRVGEDGVGQAGEVHGDSKGTAREPPAGSTGGDPTSLRAPLRRDF